MAVVVGMKKTNDHAEPTKKSYAKLTKKNKKTDRAAVNVCAAKTLICEYYSGIWKSDIVRVP